MYEQLQFPIFPGDDALLQRMRNSWLKAIAGDGAICPCCDRHGKVYRIRLHQTFALALRWIYLNGDEEGWVNVQTKGPRFILKSKNYGMLTHWGLIESFANRSGIWRITPKGKAFANGQIMLPASIFIYDNNLFGFSEEETSYRGCFKETFNFDEMMSARFDWTKIKGRDK
jgi:hypothetical protein